MYIYIYIYIYTHVCCLGRQWSQSEEERGGERRERGLQLLCYLNCHYNCYYITVVIIVILHNYITNVITLTIYIQCSIVVTSVMLFKLPSVLVLSISFIL